MSTSCVLELRQHTDIKQHHQGRLSSDHAKATEITRSSCDTLSYNDFFWNHMHRNWPVVLTSVSNTWPCRQNWTKENNTNTTEKCLDTLSITSKTKTNTAINYDYLRLKVGNRRVPVADCAKEYFNSHAKFEMNFYDYIDYWQLRSEGDEINHNDTAQLTPMNSNLNIYEPTAKDQIENLYLKDWHLKAQMPEYDFYTVPKYFASDWLNEYLVENGKDDYRFVYMGPKDSWTPFHTDVFGSYSWSTNIIGCKRWLLLPPGEEISLKDSLGNMPFRISEQLLKEKHVQHFIIDQLENESIFVPSGWYHQVHNITDTISVNHNWFNGCNVEKIWKNLATSMQQVIAEIEDCRQMEDFDEHCQTMLRASFGIHFYDFLNILEYIATKRTQQCNNNLKLHSTDETYLVFGKYSLSNSHVHFDLHCIQRVVLEILENQVIRDNRDRLYRRCLALKELTKNF